MLHGVYVSIYRYYFFEEQSPLPKGKWQASVHKEVVKGLLSI